MKKIIIVFAGLLLGNGISAQLTKSENYVSTKTYLDYPTGASEKVAQKVQYFDGLGRPKQVVDVKASPLQNDIVSHFQYDDPFGRETKTYLPVPQQGTQYGGISTSPLVNAPSVYGSEKIYTEKVLENSPLNRVEQQINEGWDWNSRPVLFEEGTNAADVVKAIASTTMIDGATLTSIVKKNYKAGELFRKTTTDEDGNQTSEFTNGKGQMILSRKTTGSTDNADTYYVYNEYGHLAYIIPPLLAKMTSWGSKDIANLGYTYRYDGRGRMVEKRLPGKGLEYIVYDRHDRPILTQDAELQKKSEWLFTKYDKFGRVTYTGITQNSAIRKDLQKQADNYTGTTNEDRSSFFDRSSMTIYYSNNAFPTSIKDVYTIKYYDKFPESKEFKDFPPVIFGQEVILRHANDKAKGMLAASYTKNIENDGWTKTFYAYDSRGREISSYSFNHLGGYTKKEAQLNFAGLPKKTVTSHRREASAKEPVITETFEYDHQNRLLKHWHQVDTEPVELLAENKYNEISQLENRKVGNDLQSIDYAYNIRGWRTQINDPENLGNKLFGYKIKYDKPVNNPYLAKYNGNISEIDWKNAEDGILRTYNYEYDRLNRLTKATYSEPGSTLPNNGAYNESLVYDLNGNIQYLERNTYTQNFGVQPIDKLTYKYFANTLLSVTDNSGVYNGYPEISGNQIKHDLNGNMTDHIDRGIISIGYNYLNLPNSITFDKTYLNHDLINSFRNNTQYLYRADGVKVRKEYIYGSGTSNLETHKVTDYLDGFQYTDKVLNFIPTSGGYYNFEQKKYIYNYTDQVENVRVSFYKGPGGFAVIDRTTNYYPFGLEFNESIIPANSITPNYRRSTQGQEKQEDTKWSSFKWRNYDPTFGRFFNVDPLSEQYTTWSPYAFSGNRVVDSRELEGLEPVDTKRPQDLPGNEMEFTEFIGGGINSFRAAVSNTVVRTLNVFTNDAIRNQYKVGDDGRMILEIGVPKESFKEKVVNGSFDLATIGVAAFGGVQGALTAQGGKAPALKAIEEVKSLAKAGRSGKQTRLRELAKDTKVSSFNRGWIKNEIRHIENGNRKTIRNPRNSRNSKTRGTELAHPKNQRAKDGHSYEKAQFQDADLHKLEHKYEGYK